MTRQRCRYTPDVRGEEPEEGRICCWRAAHGDSDRCIWHRDSGGKSVAELADHEPRPGDRLDGAVLRGLTLEEREWFADCVLIGADFSGSNLIGVDFGGADLRKASFSDATARETAFRSANLESADMTGIDLRDADLTRAKLDQADMTNARINRRTVLGEKTIYEEEMRAYDGFYEKENALEAAVRVYRKFETLSHDNSLYGQASSYFRRSKDIRRRLNWQRNNYGDAFVSELSRIFTGYGNRPWRVILTSVAVILCSAAIYPLAGGLRRTIGNQRVYAFHVGEPSLGHAISVAMKSVYFSVVTFTTLGYGNLEPINPIGRYVAGVEALLGSVLLALLVTVLTYSTWLR